MSSALWFIAGIAVGSGITLVLAMLWRGPAAGERPPPWRYALPLAAAALAASAVVIPIQLRGHARRTDTAADTGDSMAMSASHTAAIDEYRDKVVRDPRDAGAWLTLAGLYRQQHAYAPAREAFAKLIELDAMSADAWADYADVQASLAGSLAGEPAASIDRALALEPAHPKALWLKASLAHQQGDEAQALALWTRLRAVLPDDSSDTRLVDDNIAEARRLTGAVGKTAAVAAASVVAVTGTVALDPRFAARVPPGTPLFVFARAAGDAGPPVAVLRTVTGAWPLRFRLDDSLSMLPTRKLSDFDTVTVEARVSRSGQATAASGDLFAVSAPVHPRDGKPLALTIAQERP